MREYRPRGRVIDCIIAALLGFVVTFGLGELYIRFWS